jgi:hypothetical protein
MTHRNALRRSIQPLGKEQKLLGEKMMQSWDFQSSFQQFSGQFLVKSEMGKPYDEPAPVLSS